MRCSPSEAMIFVNPPLARPGATFSLYSVPADFSIVFLQFMFGEGRGSPLGQKE